MRGHGQGRSLGLYGGLVDIAISVRFCAQPKNRERKRTCTNKTVSSNGLRGRSTLVKERQFRSIAHFIVSLFVLHVSTPHPTTVIILATHFSEIFKYANVGVKRSAGIEAVRGSRFGGNAVFLVREITSAAVSRVGTIA